MSTNSVVLDSARTKAYSSELRWRMVHQRLVLGNSYRHIGEQLCVDPSTVQRTLRLFEETGTVYSIQGYHEPSHKKKKLTENDEMVLLELIIEHPAMYLQELQSALSRSTGTNISISTICKFLQKQGITYKKLSFQAQQRNDELCQKYFQIYLCWNHTCSSLWMKQGQTNVLHHGNLVIPLDVHVQLHNDSLLGESDSQP